MCIRDSVYACDHFVYPEYKMGNLTQQPLTEIVLSSKPVSYTHLDVYKRQVEGKALERGVSLKDLSLIEMDILWDEVKKEEK